MFSKARSHPSDFLATNDNIDLRDTNDFSNESPWRVTLGSVLTENPNHLVIVISAVLVTSASNYHNQVNKPSDFRDEWSWITISMTSANNDQLTYDHIEHNDPRDFGNMRTWVTLVSSVTREESNFWYHSEWQAW